MNNHECNEEFQISYNDCEVPVKVMCDENDMYFLVNFPDGEVKLLHDVDEEGRDYWVDGNEGETEFANELGELIEFAAFETALAV